MLQSCAFVPWGSPKPLDPICPPEPRNLRARNPCRDAVNLRIGVTRSGAEPIKRDLYVRLNLGADSKRDGTPLLVNELPPPRPSPAGRRLDGSVSPLNRDMSRWRVR